MLEGLIVRYAGLAYPKFDHETGGRTGEDSRCPAAGAHDTLNVGPETNVVIVGFVTTPDSTWLNISLVNLGGSPLTGSGSAGFTLNVTAKLRLHAPYTKYRLPATNGMPAAYGVVPVTGSTNVSDRFCCKLVGPEVSVVQVRLALHPGSWQIRRRFAGWSSVLRNKSLESLEASKKT